MPIGSVTIGFDRVGVIIGSARGETGGKAQNDASAARTQVQIAAARPWRARGVVGAVTRAVENAHATQRQTPMVGDRKQDIHRWWIPSPGDVSFGGLCVSWRR